MISLAFPNYEVISLNKRLVKLTFPKNNGQQRPVQPKSVNQKSFYKFPKMLRDSKLNQMFK